jgi:hypothetical protein
MILFVQGSRGERAWILTSGRLEVAQTAQEDCTTGNA